MCSVERRGLPRGAAAAAHLHGDGLPAGAAGRAGLGLRRLPHRCLPPLLHRLGPGLPGLPETEQGSESVRRGHVPSTVMTCARPRMALTLRGAATRDQVRCCSCPTLRDRAGCRPQLRQPGGGRQHCWPQAASLAVAWLRWARAGAGAGTAWMRSPSSSVSVPLPSPAPAPPAACCLKGSPSELIAAESGETWLSVPAPVLALPTNHVHRCKHWGPAHASRQIHRSMALREARKYWRAGAHSRQNRPCRPTLRPARPSPMMAGSGEPIRRPQITLPIEIAGQSLPDCYVWAVQ